MAWTGVGAQGGAVASEADSGTEVTVFGPAKVLRDELGRLAVRKLQLRLARSAGQNESDRPPSRESGTSRLV